MSKKILFGLVIFALFLTANVFAVDIELPAKEESKQNLQIQSFTNTIPQKIAISGVYQEKDTATNKMVPATGTFRAVFSVYDSENGGKLIWKESKEIITDSSGVFFTYLDEFSLKSSPIPFDKPYFVEITMGKKDILLPRQPLTSVPYALNASKLEGKSLSEVKTEIQQAGGIAGGDAVVKNPTAEQVIKGYPLVINSKSSTSALEVLNSESAANFKTTDPKAISPALVVENNGTGIGIDSLVESGPAGKFQSKTGTAGYFKTIGGDYPTLVVKNEGIGIAGRFEVIDQSSKSNALEVTNNGTGTGIDSLVESGLAGKFQSRKGTALYSKSGMNGQGAAIFENNSPSFSTITAENKGNGIGVDTNSLQTEKAKITGYKTKVKFISPINGFFNYVGKLDIIETTTPFPYTAAGDTITSNDLVYLYPTVVDVWCKATIPLSLPNLSIIKRIKLFYEKREGDIVVELCEFSPASTFKPLPNIIASLNSGAPETSSFLGGVSFYKYRESNPGFFVLRMLKNSNLGGNDSTKFYGIEVEYQEPNIEFEAIKPY